MLAFAVDTLMCQVLVRSPVDRISVGTFVDDIAVVFANVLVDFAVVIGDFVACEAASPPTLGIRKCARSFLPGRFRICRFGSGSLSLALASLFMPCRTGRGARSVEG